MQRAEVAQGGDAQRDGGHTLACEARQKRADGAGLGLGCGMQDLVKLGLADEGGDSGDSGGRDGGSIAALLKAELLDRLAQIAGGQAARQRL